MDDPADFGDTAAHHASGQAKPSAAFEGGFPERPDLSRLPAYRDPPRKLNKAERNAGQTSTIAVVLLTSLVGGMLAGGYVRFQPAIHSSLQATAAAPDPVGMPVSAPPAPPPALQQPAAPVSDVPLPAAPSPPPRAPVAIKAHGQR